MDQKRFFQLCDNVAEEVCKNLTQISDELKVDENTVWLTFRQCLEEKEIKVEIAYNRSHIDGIL